jgi:hypothetical protein
MLTADEAKEMKDALSDALQTKDEIYHDQIDDTEYKHEISFGIYRDDNMHTFNQRVQRLIKDDT